jgi:hypothetical protein
MQVTRIADQIVVSGGLPDFEFGGWRRRVKAGERFAGPTAIATCVKGDIQDAFSNLNSWPSTTPKAPPRPKPSCP